MKEESVRCWSSERAAAGARRLAIGRSMAAELVGKIATLLDPGQDLSETKISPDGAHGGSRAGAPPQTCSGEVLELISSHGLG